MDTKGKVESKKCPNCGQNTLFVYGYKGQRYTYCTNCGEKWTETDLGWFLLQEGKEDKK